MSAAAHVTVYTTRYCPYCFAARRLLDGKGIAYREIACDGREDLRQWLFEASRQSTVPQIFVNGRSIGGYSELSLLDKRGQLERVLGEPPADDAPSVDNGALRS